MSFFKKNSVNMLQHKRWVFIYFILLNIPLLLGTFHTSNWSDDYQLTNLFAVKAKFSPLLPLLFNPVGGHLQYGGHLAPFYNLINIFISSVSLNPQFFHLVIWICYTLSAFLVFLIAKRYYSDEKLGVLAGTLFALNYYIGFRAFAYNCFHSHLTNVLTGILSLYFMTGYLKFRKSRYIFFSSLCLAFTILNLESGFVFCPLIILAILFSWIKKEVDFKRMGLAVLIILFTMTIFPISSYIKTGKANPLSYRFAWQRSTQGYAFYAQDILVKSAGISILFNKTIVDRLKEDVALKQAVVQLVRENKSISLANLLRKFIVLAILGTLLCFIILILIIREVLKRAHSETYLFISFYLCLFFIYLFVFYRTDIINALALPSSIIIADLLISFLRDQRRYACFIGKALIALFMILTIWTIMDKFDDCYKKSFQGLSKMAINGPDKIYNEINSVIGRFAKDGVIIFTHDYSLYHKATGVERIGDLLNVSDFACFNASIFYKELLKTGLKDEYKNKSFHDFTGWFLDNNNYQKIVVSSRDDALKYLRTNHIDTGKVEAIYISKDYKVDKLNVNLAKKSH